MPALELEAGPANPDRDRELEVIGGIAFPNPTIASSGSGRDSTHAQSSTALRSLSPAIRVPKGDTRS